jgi:fructokinase
MDRAGSATETSTMSARIGVDLGGTKIAAIALDSAGRTLAERRVRTPRDDYAATVEAVGALVVALETEIGRTATVGIGTPGAVSPATSLMKNCNSVWLNGRPLHRDLAEALGRPVRIANDADCLALSEATDGAGVGARAVFAVILGTGTGGGVVVDGRLLAGPNAIAGEWGHNPLPWPREGEWPGAPCYCGRTGCIETFLSGPGLARDYERATRRVLAPEEVVASAGRGEPEAEAALERHRDRAARALASVINLLDPHVIVLGGGLSNLPGLVAGVPALWARWVFSDRVDTKLALARHGDASGVRGAALLWEREIGKRAG